MADGSHMNGTQNVSTSNLFRQQVPGIPSRPTRGSNPMWSPDGRRLFYVHEANPEAGRGRATFVSIDVLGTGASFESGKTTALFTVDGVFIAGSGPGNYVDLSPDGKQFVTLLLPPARPESEPERGQVNVVLNWFADLKQRVPVK